MDEVDALYVLVDFWIKVKPLSILNCWNHTNFLNSKPGKGSVDEEELLPTTELPLDDDLVEELNAIIPSLSGNKDDKGRQLVSAVDQLDLTADESTLIVVEPPIVEFVDDENEAEVVEEKIEEEKEEVIDVQKIREDLKRSYETILYHTVPLDDKENTTFKVMRRKLNELRPEEIAEEKQRDVRVYFY
jgi:hypothetical protein